MDDNQPDRSMMRVHVIVEGRVQGVGFRYFVKENAHFLRLTGWVRNRWDDTVEVSAEGDRADLEKLLAAIRRGSGSSWVENLKIDWEEYQGEFGGFTIRPTL